MLIWNQKFVFLDITGFALKKLKFTNRNMVNFCKNLLKNAQFFSTLNRLYNYI